MITEATNERSRACRDVECEIRPSSQCVINSMFGNPGGRQFGRAEQEEDTVGKESRVRTGDVGFAGPGVNGTSLEGERGCVCLTKAGSGLDDDQSLSTRGAPQD